MTGARGRGAQRTPGSLFRPTARAQQQVGARADGWAEGPRAMGRARAAHSDFPLCAHRRCPGESPHPALSGGPCAGVRSGTHTAREDDPCGIRGWGGRGSFFYSMLESDPSLWAPPAARIWKESASEWGGEVEARGWVTGTVGAGGSGRDPTLCTENLGPGHPATFHVSSAWTPPSPT